MTCKEVGEFVEQQQKHEKNQTIMISTTGYRIAQMLILSNGMCVKKPTILKFEELFPELEAENNTSKEDAIQNRWREFLGVVK